MPAHGLDKIKFATDAPRRSSLAKRDAVRRVKWDRARLASRALLHFSRIGNQAGRDASTSSPARSTPCLSAEETAQRRGPFQRAFQQAEVLAEQIVEITRSRVGQVARRIGHLFAVEHGIAQSPPQIVGLITPESA